MSYLTRFFDPPHLPQTTWNAFFFPICAVLGQVTLHTPNSKGDASFANEKACLYLAPPSLTGHLSGVKPQPSASCKKTKDEHKAPLSYMAKFIPDR